MRRITSGLAFRFVASIAVTAIGVALAVYIYNDRISRRMILKDAQAAARAQTASAAYRIEASLRTVEAKTDAMATYLAFSSRAHAPMEGYLKELITTQPEIFGATIALEPFANTPNPGTLYAPYFFEKDGALSFRDLSVPTYGYQTRDWYQDTVAAAKPMWSKPYFGSAAGMEPMVTYAVPIVKRDGVDSRVLGVVTADVSLAMLDEFMRPLSTQEGTYAFLVTSDGTFLSHHRKDIVMRKKLGEILTAPSEVDTIVRPMLTGSEGFAPYRSRVTGREGFIYFMPLAKQGWIIVLVSDGDTLFASFEAINRTNLQIGLVGLVALLTIMGLLAVSITRPVRALAGLANELSAGNFDVPIHERKGDDELAALIRAFSHMRTELKAHIERIREATATRQRMESELNVARSIQRASLPPIPSPIFTETFPVSLHAVMKPADKVGGDLFDFALIQDRFLYFLVGDVSGKGIAAAMFMVQTRAALRELLGQNLAPSRILSAVNSLVCRENESTCMFLTLLIGRLDVHTGELHLSSAGHDNPILKTSDGTVEEVPLPKGLACGFTSGSTYSDYAVKLAQGSSLVLYTDGVTEAENESGEFFTRERLVSSLASFEVLPPTALVDAVLGAIRTFAKTAPQSDDIAVMAVHVRRPNAAVRETSVEAALENLDSIITMASEPWASAPLPGLALYNLQVVLEELFVNVCTHGVRSDGDAKPTVTVRLERTPGGVAWSFTDSGAPFNPVEAPPSPSVVDAASAPIGGKGLTLVKELARHLSYSYDGTFNRLAGVVDDA